jgi:putative membrane protein
MRKNKNTRYRNPLQFLTITGFSIAGLQLLVMVTQDVKKRDVYEEIAQCAPTAIVKTAMVSGQFMQDALADKDFAMQAGEAGMAEVSLGELAIKNASSGEVKDFAKMMITDHTKANDELKAMAEKKGITLPADCNMCRDKSNQLSNLKGKDFDKKYMDMMVADHKEVISKFNTESASGKDQDMKSWAAAKLPALQHHLSEAQKIKL